MALRGGTWVSVSAHLDSEAGVTGVAFRARAVPHGDIRLGGMVLQVHGRDIHAVWTAAWG